MDWKFVVLLVSFVILVIFITSLLRDIEKKDKELAGMNHNAIDLYRQIQALRNELSHAQSRISTENRHFVGTEVREVGNPIPYFIVQGDEVWSNPGRVMHSGHTDPAIGRLSDNDMELLETLRRGGPFAVEKNARIVKQDSFFD